MRAPSFCLVVLFLLQRQQRSAATERGFRIVEPQSHTNGYRGRNAALTGENARISVANINLWRKFVSEFAFKQRYASF